MELFISELFPEKEMKEVIERNGCGIELITFSISEHLDRFAETMHEAREMLHRLGDPPLSIHGPFLDLNPVAFDSRIQQVTFDRFEQAYEAAVYLGAKKIVYHSGMVPTVYYLEGWADRAIDFFGRFMEGKQGIGVCMENVLDREPSAHLAVASAVRHPDFGLCLDLGHAHCYSPYEAGEWAEMLKGHITHVHLHDNDKSADRHLAIGDGTIPYDELLPKLLAENPGLTGTVECASKDEAERSLAYLAQKEAGLC